MKRTESIFGVLKITLSLTGRICFSSLVPLLSLLLILPVFGAQSAVVFTNLYSFTGTNDGKYPQAGLVQGSDGYLYGTTFGGGTNNYGTVFKIDPSGALSSLHSFGSITNAGGEVLDGTWSCAALVQSSDGYLYGTTENGGTNGGGGTVFKISTDGALMTFCSFSGTHYGDGANYIAGLVQGSDGYLYGTTFGGGTGGWGTVFRISTNGALTNLYSFGTVIDAGGDPLDGAYPCSALVQSSDGYLYGTTQEGGTNTQFFIFGGGTVFKISTNGVLTTLYSFGSVQDTNNFAPLDGAHPNGLVQGSDGYLYGTTGGIHTHGTLFDLILYGTVFKISTNGVLTTLHSFNGGNDGANPQAALLEGSDGNFYGTTEDNYAAYGYPSFSGPGTMFRISTNGTLTTLYAFGSITNASGSWLDGGYPCAALMLGTDGSFYGTTSGGGKNGAGTVFRLTIVPEPPQLTIILSSANVILTWPTDATGFNLQSTTNLGSSAVWTTNSSQPVVVNGENTVTNPISGTQQYFRLSQLSPVGSKGTTSGRN